MPDFPLAILRHTCSRGGGPHFGNCLTLEELYRPKMQSKWHACAPSLPVGFGIHRVRNQKYSKNPFIERCHFHSLITKTTFPWLVTQYQLTRNSY